MRTRVKICGITRRQDAEFAVEMGVDALGLVFYAPSPRAVTIAQAQDIVVGLSPLVSIVALFVNADSEYVKACLAALPISILQFHGDESVEYCEQFNHPYMKALRMREGIDLKAVAHQYKSASAILLDSYQPGVPGGTGQVFDWSLVDNINMPVILAGGLDAENVVQAIKQVAPYAVDVSGGVELAKGIKDNNKVRNFMQEVVNV
ncbi:MAG: phosphoribosylanthranilate isomerase [Methylophaga sp.]|nr:MAG: phosphoribosylanthranilate isomerase [Methylophaga sp.]